MALRARLSHWRVAARAPLAAFSTVKTWMISPSAGENGDGRIGRHAGPRCCWSSRVAGNPRDRRRAESARRANGARRTAAPVRSAPVSAGGVMGRRLVHGSSSVSLHKLDDLIEHFAPAPVRFFRCRDSGSHLRSSRSPAGCAACTAAASSYARSMGRIRSAAVWMIMVGGSSLA